MKFFNRSFKAQDKCPQLCDYDYFEVDKLLKLASDSVALKIRDQKEENFLFKNLAAVIRKLKQNLMLFTVKF